MTLVERDPDEYVERYIFDKKQRTTRNMAYGSMLAEGLEHGELTGDPMLDLMMVKMPKFERMDLPVEDAKGVEVEFDRGNGSKKIKIPALKDDRWEKIPLLAIPDTARGDYSAIKEYKSSTRTWTQKMADDSGQITFYATTIWLIEEEKKDIPDDIELVCVPTEYDEEGRLSPTGEIVRLPTQRSMADIIKMTKRIRKAWGKIHELCESELL